MRLENSVVLWYELENVIGNVKVCKGLMNIQDRVALMLNSESGGNGNMGN